jgi:hypothetical protein
VVDIRRGNMVLLALRAHFYSQVGLASFEYQVGTTTTTATKSAAGLSVVVADWSIAERSTAKDAW